jgi:uncharacterized iron-regulated membrane protein
MLLLCLTGLPLIFHHEIGHLLGTEAEPIDLPADTKRVSLDQVLDTARVHFPGKDGMFISQERGDDRVWYVTMSDTPTSSTDLKQVAIDARTGEILAEPQLDNGFMFIMRSLHIDLFAGLKGMLFLGFMGILLLISLVSGAVLYAPFMRKLKFAQVRRKRSRRTQWLDLHNLLGIVTLVWLFVVGITGVLNTGADLLVKHWQNNQLADMVKPYQDLPVPARYGSLEAAVQVAREHEPDMSILFIAFPGTSFSSPHHFGVFMYGNTPLTEQLSKPVLVDSVTAEFTDSRSMPWYLSMLQLSRPLHFGDYGGMPLQLIWAVLDIISIIVLASGLYLWIARRRFAVKPVTQGVVHEA